MRINEIITEGRPSQQQVVNMYHGTSSVFLPSIQKVGLDPNSPKKSYGADRGSAWASYGGVYLASNRIIAQEAAIAAVKIHGGTPILITVQFVLGSGGMDEDQANDIIFNAFFEAKNADEFVASLTNTLKNRFKITYPKNSYKDFIDLYNLMQSRYMQWVKDDPNPQGTDARTNFVYWTPERLGDNMFKDTDVYIGYRPYRSQVEKILNKTKVFHVISDNGDITDTTITYDTVNVRVSRPIRFKGKTRIIKIEKSPYI